MNAPPENFAALEKSLQELPSFKASLLLRLKLAILLKQRSFEYSLTQLLTPLRFSVRILSTGFLSLFILFASLTSYAYFSSSVGSSTPFLGALKIASENVQLALTDDINHKVTLHLVFAQKRVDELDKVLASGDLKTETVRNATNKAFEALRMAKDTHDLRTRVATAKNITQISNQAAGTAVQLKNMLLEEKATEKANAENLSEEVLREIKYRAQGIILGPSAVAANTEPSLESNPANRIVTKDLYVLAEDPRRESAQEELSEASKLASQIIYEVGQDPELQEVIKVIGELKEKGDINKLASELEILP